MRTLTSKFILALSIVAIASVTAPVSAVTAAEVEPTSGGYFCWRLYNNVPLTLDFDAHMHSGVVDQTARCLAETREGSS